MSTFGDNPTGKAFERMDDDGLRFRVKHYLPATTPGGVIPPGRIVSRKDLGPGAQLDRLMRLGSLVQVVPGPSRDGFTEVEHQELAPPPPPAMPESLKAEQPLA